MMKIDKEDPRRRGDLRQSEGGGRNEKDENEFSTRSYSSPDNILLVQLNGAKGVMKEPVEKLLLDILVAINKLHGCEIRAGRMTT